jgi:hypothetical protein
MQFRQQIAANKHAITGIKSRSLYRGHVKLGKTCTKRRPWAGDSFAGSLTWFSTRCDIAWIPLQRNSQLRVVGG